MVCHIYLPRVYFLTKTRRCIALWYMYMSLILKVLLFCLVTLGLNDIKNNEPSPPLLLLVLKTELKDTAATKLLEITATDGQAKARLLAWGSIAQFFHTKIKEKETYLFENTLIKATPTRYLKADMIPFDITLNSGATVASKKANIQIPEPNFTKIDTLQSMINRRTNLRALIIDYDESVSNVSLQSGSVATKRELTIADNTGFKIQATLWGETANTFRPQLGRAVMIENALIKSYLQNVTASVDNIVYCHDPHSQELELWYERHGDDEIEQLCATAKRRLVTNEYPLLDNVSTLSSIENGTCVKVRDKITSLELQSMMPVVTARLVSFKWVVTTFALNAAKLMFLLHKRFYLHCHCQILQLLLNCIMTMCQTCST